MNQNPYPAVRRIPMNLDYMHPREGAMLQRQLSQMEHQAHTLRRVLHPDDNVPAWTQAKVATAQDRLSAVHNYLVPKIHSNMDWGGITDSDIAYAFSDLGKFDGEENEDLGITSGAARRKRQRFKKAKSKGRTKRQVAILMRVALKVAKQAGKKVSRVKAMRAAKKAEKKSARAAVILGLIAGGLSGSDARKYATLALATIRAGGSKKGIEKSLKRQAARRKKFLAKKKATAKTPNEAAKADNDLKELEAEDAGLSDESDPMEEEDFSQEDAEDAESTKSSYDSSSSEDEIEDEDLSGILEDTFDKAKPYLPWAALAVGVVAIVTASRTTTRGNRKTARRNRR